MNILILGSGGREHALAWKLQQSEHCKKLYIAPGNAGTAQEGINIPIDISDFGDIKTIVSEKKINMVVVGPEDPLVNGIHDYFLKDKDLKHISVIGPQQEGARLEGSKEFAKQFLIRHNIPTAAYRSFGPSDLQDGFLFLESLAPPYVLKADGLAAGKGVLILKNLEEAKKELKKMLIDSKFGKASAKVVIEEFLDGIELSCFVLCDGENYKILPTAKDYKRIGEGDVGLNTGGMGAVSPVPFANREFMQKIEDRIVKPTINGLKQDKIPYKGFVFIGLIKVNGDPYVIEYNVRMGDPETEVVIPRIKNDLVQLFRAVSDGKLNEIKLELDPRSATTVMAVSGGYPESYEKGKEIKGLENINNKLIFHAGTALKENTIVTNGGRVLAVTALAENHEKALKESYNGLSKIKFDKIYYRKDIGFDL